MHLTDVARDMQRGLSCGIIERRTSRRARLFAIRDQRGIASGSGCIDRYGLFSRKARQVMWPAGLWARTRQSLAPERLYPDYGADHAAVDIDIAYGKSIDHGSDGVIDAGVNAERQPVAA